MKAILGVLATLAVAGAVAVVFALANCRGPARQIAPPRTDIEVSIDGGARVLFVCCHPEDVLFAGPLLARAGENAMVLTLGPSTPEVEAACSRLGVRLAGAGFSTEAATPGEPRVRPQDLKNLVITRWARSGRDPRDPIADAIRAFKPDILLTFDVDQGFTGDKEHRAVGQLVLAVFEDEPHPTRVYCIVNRFPRMMEAPIPTIARSQIVEIASSRTALSDGSTPYEKTMAAFEVFWAKRSREVTLFSEEQWERLLRETALVIAAQRDADTGR